MTAVSECPSPVEHGIQREGGNENDRQQGDAVKIAHNTQTLPDRFIAGSFVSLLHRDNNDKSH
jgi:hypothetical protein